jgi:hypothetical protein
MADVAMEIQGKAAGGREAHLLSEDMVTVRPKYFSLQKLRPAIFTVEKFCATSLANSSESHCI